MATKATVYKAHLNVADTDRGYYADHALTLALHPSETEERLTVRQPTRQASATNNWGARRRPSFTACYRIRTAS